MAWKAKKTSKASSSNLPNSGGGTSRSSAKRTSSGAKYTLGGNGARTMTRASGRTSSALAAPQTRQARSDASMTPDGMSIRIVLPLPAKQLSPNARVCWQAKARAVKQYRSISFFVSQRFPSRWKAAEVESVFFFRDRRRRDRDNLLASLKAAFDGIASAGIVDDDASLTHLPVRLEVDRDAPRVEISIRRTE